MSALAAWKLAMCYSTDTRATLRPTVFTKTVSPASLDQLATARGLPP
jgi:hypothetical protein